MGVAEVGAFQLRSFEGGARHVRLAKITAFQMCPFEVGTLQVKIRYPAKPVSPTLRCEPGNIGPCQRHTCAVRSPVKRPLPLAVVGLRRPAVEVALQL